MHERFEQLRARFDRATRGAYSGGLGSPDIACLPNMPSTSTIGPSYEQRRSTGCVAKMQAHVGGEVQPALTTFSTDPSHAGSIGAHSKVTPGPLRRTTVIAGAACRGLADNPDLGERGLRRRISLSAFAYALVPGTSLRRVNSLIRDRRREPMLCHKRRHRLAARTLHRNRFVLLGLRSPGL